MPGHMKRSHKRKSRRSRRTRKRRGGREFEQMNACIRSGAGVMACRRIAKQAAKNSKEALNKENLVKACRQSRSYGYP